MPDAHPRARWCSATTHRAGCRRWLGLWLLASLWAPASAAGAQAASPDVEPGTSGVGTSDVGETDVGESDPDASPPDEAELRDPVGRDSAAHEPTAEVPVRPPHVPYRRGMGRGLVYGTSLIAPIYVTSVDRAGGGETLSPGAGAGLHLRLGWEFPDGFTLELYGGIAFTQVARVSTEPSDRSHVWTQGDWALGVRYDLFNDTPLVPFARVGAGFRLLYFTWGSGDEARPLASIMTGGTLGVHLELAPYFGIELGVSVDYTFSIEGFDAGFLAVTPFAGVSLFLFDENDPVF